MRVLPTFPFNCEENAGGGSGKVHCWFPESELLTLSCKKIGQFPDELVRIEVAQIHYVTSQTYQE